MTINPAKRTAELIAKRKTRVLTFKDAIHLMMSAQRKQRSYQGNIDWLRSVEGKFDYAYLVPVQSVRLRSADVRCLLACPEGGSNYVWLTVDVSPWTIVRLRSLGAPESVELIGKLVAGYPSVTWDGSVSNRNGEP
ncbi:hypothetical protein [Streptomyces radiopugnans]|uniref:hypothetical protein n=1 Tax=Streptomyces radiopugnans TaxID=403935 RepID=UPI003F19ED27